MPADAIPPQPTATLALKLSAAIAILVALLLLFLLGYLGPVTTTSFQRHSDELLRRSGTAMRGLVDAQTDSTAHVLADLLEHDAAARAAALADLPLEIHSGDLAQLRTAIAADDQTRSEQRRANVPALVAAMQRSTTRRIDDHLAELVHEQAVFTAAFAADLRRGHVVFCAVTLLTTLVVLVFGLRALVLQPVTRLRLATRRVAAGDYDVAIETRSRDEVGALAADFARMAAVLREQRQELLRLQHGLEAEVQRKTAHLEQALHDLRQSHGQLVRAERLASIGTLAGGIAHEFNNLIGGIRGCAAELRQDEPDAERQATLDVILRASDRAASITQQLLRFARRSVEKFVATDLASVVGDAVRLIEPEAKRRQVAIEQRIATVPAVHADGDAIHQVIVNLLTNALQAMPGGGSLSVEVGPAPGGVQVAVHDTGHGIPAAELDRIFEPFYSNRRDPAAGPGTGLGLSVSYGIVTAHGGRIDVRSAEGSGTTFTVFLPSTHQH